MRDNKAKRALRAGRPVLAVSLAFVHAGIAEYLTRLGFDCLMLDAEHGAIADRDVEDVLRVCEPSGASLLVHMPLNGETFGRYLAIGVSGFHVAMVRSGAMAREVVEVVKFPPSGKRGLGSFRVADYGFSIGSWPEFMARSNEETFVSVSVEDRDGLAAAPEFARIPEIDVIQVAASDLSSSLGVPGQTRHEKVMQADAQIVALARSAGKAAGIAIGSPVEMRQAYDRGSRFMIVSLARMMRLGTDAFLAELRELERRSG